MSNFTIIEAENRFIISLNGSYMFSAPNAEGAKTIIEALGKQIVKTPLESFYNEGDYTWECVNCEETVDEGQNYCHHCGQKLVEWEG